MSKIRGQINLHENMVMEFRMVGSKTPMLMTEGLNWRDILTDIVQAAASTGAIAGTGGAGGDVVVDVMFAIKTGKEVLDTVMSMIESAAELTATFTRIIALDIAMGASAFLAEVKSILGDLLRAAGEFGREILQSLRESIEDIIGSVVRAISKWVASIMPDDFGLAGPAFEGTVTTAIDSLAENSYNLLMSGIMALGATATLVLNEEAFRNWLEGIVDSILEYAHQFLREAEHVDPEKAGWISSVMATQKFSLERLAKGGLPGMLAQKVGLLDDKGFIDDYLEVLPTLPENHPTRKLILMGSRKSIEWIEEFRADTIPVAAMILHKLMTYLIGSVAVLQLVSLHEEGEEMIGEEPVDEVPTPVA